MFLLYLVCMCMCMCICMFCMYVCIFSMYVCVYYIGRGGNRSIVEMRSLFHRTYISILYCFMKLSLFLSRFCAYSSSFNGHKAQEFALFCRSIDKIASKAVAVASVCCELMSSRRRGRNSVHSTLHWDFDMIAETTPSMSRTVGHFVSRMILLQNLMIAGLFFSPWNRGLFLP